MKTRLLFAIVLLVAAFTIPSSAEESGNNCTFTCSTGWTGEAWAANAETCAAGCRAMCVTCVSSVFKGSEPLND